MQLYPAMMSRYEQSPSPVPTAINIVDVIRGIGRRKLFILSMGLLSFAGSAGLVNTLKPVYTTEAQVLIQNLETPFDRVQTTENQRGDTIDDRVVASQISILKSEDLGRRVVAALGLETKAEFNPLISGVGQVGRIKIALGFGTDPRLKTPGQRALDHYVNKLSVFQLPDSNVIGVKYSSSNPQMAAKIANTLADTYVMWTREAQSRPTERAREWLSQQIDSLRKKLASTEAEVERFRINAGLLQGATSTLGTQEISELNTQITVAKSASLEARTRADSIRDILETRGSVDAATDVLASASVQRLKEQRTDAARRLAELSVTYLPNHPRYIAAQKEISNIDKQIRSEALRIVSSLDEQARIAEAREKSLLANLNALKVQEGSANLDDVKLKALERDAAADRALLEAMLSRYAEASARHELSAQPGFGVIIQSASVPSSPSFPKTGPMVLLITIAGLSFGVGLAFLMELMAAASRLAIPHDARMDRIEPPFETASPQPVMEPIAPDTPVVALTDAQSEVAEPAAQPEHEEPAAAVSQPLSPETAFQHLVVWPKIIPQGDLSGLTDHAEFDGAVTGIATWVDDLHRHRNIRRFGLTSVGGGTADAPVACLALARKMARTGRRVVLVDLARMGAFLGELCGAADGAGLSELVTGTTDFTKVIGRDRKSTVHVLRFGKDHSQHAADLILERIESVLAALTKTYDTVIVNLGEASNETPIYLHKCQAALIMAPASRLEEAVSATQTLLSTGLAAARHILIGQPLSGGQVEEMTIPEAVSG